MEKILKLKKENIYFHGELGRDELHRELQNYDIAFIPLIKRIYGSVPSKIFEYTRLGLPVLYAAGGEGGEIVKKELQHFINTVSVTDLKLFPKEDVQRNSVSAFNFHKQFEGFTALIESI